MTHYAFFIILHLYSRHSIDAAVKEINLMVKHFKTTTNLFFFFFFHFFSFSVHHKNGRIYFTYILFNWIFFIIFFF